MQCRDHCGACCIAPSISSPIPGMPQGKPAGVRCVQLDEGNRCRLFGQPERPAVCAALRPCPSMCGGGRGEALAILLELEEVTRPPVAAVASERQASVSPPGPQPAPRYSSFNRT